jgi:hypothetical protein
VQSSPPPPKPHRAGTTALGANSHNALLHTQESVQIRSPIWVFGFGLAVCYIARLELVIVLPQSPECWVCATVPCSWASFHKTDLV